MTESELTRLVECVPNVSEGRRHAVVDEIVDAFARADPGVMLLDRSSDPDHNRTVITLMGPGPALVEAAVAGARTCASLIDLNRHRGVHPRIGALDVLPFVPFGAVTRLRGGDDRDLDCTDLAVRAGRRIAEEAGVPVYLYGAAARHPGWSALPAVRGDGFEALRAALAAGDAGRPGPDFGGPGLHPTAGATAVGSREVLIAFNVVLAGADLALARRIASAVRERGGGLPAVRAMGVPLEDRVQVSMNLLDWRVTSPAEAYAAVAALAERHGARVEASEVVGLAPTGAFDGVDPADLRLHASLDDQLLESRLLQALTVSKEIR